MHPTGWIADAYDRNRAFASGVIDGWIADQERGSAAYVGAVVAGSATQAVMALTSGMLDALRLGQGVAQGTAGGVLMDGLRVLTVAGPAARLGRGLLTRVFAMGADTNPAAGICTWVATRIAARMTAIRHYAPAVDLLAATGQPSFVGSALNVLVSLGARVMPLPPARTIAELARATRAFAGNRGVVVFSAIWENGAHTMVAYIDEIGRFRILDRTGVVVEQLGELERIYKAFPGIANAWINESFVVHNAVPLTRRALAALGRAEQASVLGVIGLEVRMFALVGEDRYRPGWARARD